MNIAAKDGDVTIALGQCLLVTGKAPTRHVLPQSCSVPRLDPAEPRTRPPQATDGDMDGGTSPDAPGGWPPACPTEQVQPRRRSHRVESCSAARTGETQPRSTGD